jgi:hypothetical protein
LRVLIVIRVRCRSCGIGVILRYDKATMRLVFFPAATARGFWRIPIIRTLNDLNDSI